MLELFGTIKKWCSLSLLEIIPSYLSTMLETYIIKVGHYNNYMNTSPYQEEIVYDILNAGPRHRFTVMTEEGLMIVSNCVQSSGHDFHMLYVECLTELISKASFPIKWSIVDFHDQSIVQVPKEHAEDMVQLYKDAYKLLNQKIRELNPEFRLEIKGEPAIVPTLAEAKVQD